MGRRVDVDHIVGTREIAERLGVRSGTLVLDWLRRYADFPRPIAEASGVRLWDWREVQRWARTTGRLPRGVDSRRG